VRRRDFLGTTGAAALGAATAAAPGTALAATDDGGGSAARPLDDHEIHRWIEDLDARESRVDRQPTTPGLDGDLEAAGLPAGLFRDTMATLATAGAWGALGEADRRHPAVQERLRRAEPRMDRALCGMAEYLRSLGDEDLEAAGAALRADRGLAARLHDELVVEGFRARVPRRQLRRFTAAWNEAAFRLGEQDPVSFVRQTMATAERRLRAGGLDWGPSSDAGGSGAAGGAGADRGAHVMTREEAREARKREAAQGFAVAGAATVVSGAAVILIGLAAGFSFAPAIIGGGVVTIGIVLLVVALVLAIVAADLRRKRRLRDRQGS
jgi:hypothetical protein